MNWSDLSMKDRDIKLMVENGIYNSIGTIYNSFAEWRTF